MPPPPVEAAPPKRQSEDWCGVSISVQSTGVLAPLAEDVRLRIGQRLEAFELAADPTSPLRLHVLRTPDRPELGLHLGWGNDPPLVALKALPLKPDKYQDEMPPFWRPSKTAQGIQDAKAEVISAAVSKAVTSAVVRFGGPPPQTLELVHSAGRFALRTPPGPETLVPCLLRNQVVSVAATWGSQTYSHSFRVPSEGDVLPVAWPAGARPAAAGGDGGAGAGGQSGAASAGFAGTGGSGGNGGSCGGDIPVNGAAGAAGLLVAVFAMLVMRQIAAARKKEEARRAEAPAPVEAPTPAALASPSAAVSLHARDSGAGAVTPQGIDHAALPLVAFFSAVPAGTAKLDVDEEFRRVQKKLLVPGRAPSAHLRYHPSAQPSDLLDALRGKGVAILHFSGHGIDQEGLVFKSAQGTSSTVTPGALAGAIRASNMGPVSLIVLNACYSATFADEVIGATHCVIGMSSKIADQVAQSFSERLYDALFAGGTVREAFDLAVQQIVFSDREHSKLPVLLVAEGVDAANVVPLPLR